MAGHTLILGCGNTLLGDDGFGPEVIGRLKTRPDVPPGVALLDVGSGIGELLVDLALAPKKPNTIVLVDAMNSGQPPGTLQLRRLERIEHSKRCTSLHDGPTAALFKELEDLIGLSVYLLTVQPGRLGSEINPGLSGPVQACVESACELIAGAFFRHPGQRNVVGGVVTGKM